MLFIEYSFTNLRYFPFHMEIEYPVHGESIQKR